MRRFLLTGMSGAGKSAALKLLESNDTLCVDLDDGWMTNEDGEPLIDIPRVTAYTNANPTKHIVFAGCAINQREMPVDLQILLTASPEVMKERIRQRSNPFGKSEAEYKKILSDKAQIEPLLRKSSDVIIHTEQPLEDTVRQIRSLLYGWRIES